MSLVYDDFDRRFLALMKKLNEAAEVTIDADELEVIKKLYHEVF